MARIPGTCPQCGLALDAYVGQVFSYGRLRWWRSIRCDVCSCAYEEDGGEEIPADIRAAIVEEEGEYELHVDAGDTSSQVKTLKALRAVLGLTLAAAARLKTLLPGRVARGSRAEMERLKHSLEAEGVSATVEAIG